MAAGMLGTSFLGEEAIGGDSADGVVTPTAPLDSLGGFGLGDTMLGGDGVPGSSTPIPPTMVDRSLTLVGEVAVSGVPTERTLTLLGDVALLVGTDRTNVLCGGVATSATRTLTFVVDVSGGISAGGADNDEVPVRPLVPYYV